MQRPQSIQNEQLQGQKQHFLEAQSLFSPDKPKNKEAHIDWQIYSLLKRELSCVELYPFSIQPLCIEKRNLSTINSIFNEYVIVILEQYNEIPKSDSHLNTCTLFVKKEPPERAFFCGRIISFFAITFLFLKILE